MPEFIWTNPDPLVAGQTTRSIYVTELQVAANSLRSDISQSPITFIDQSVDQTMRLPAIEELKTTVNQLALDFGFSGGVENEEILNRPYVDHPIVLGEPAAGFPIINDLRQALNALVLRFNFLLIPVLNGASSSLALTENMDETDTFIDVTSVSPTGTSAGKPAHAIDDDGSFVTTSFQGGPTAIITNLRDETLETTDSQTDEDYSVSRDICADTEFIYVICLRVVDNKNVIVKYNKTDRSTGESLDSLDIQAQDPLVGFVRTSMVNSLENIFVSGRTLSLAADGITNSEAVLQKINKGITLTYNNSVTFHLKLINGATFTQDFPAVTQNQYLIIDRQADMSALTIDSNNIYAFYQESGVQVYGPAGVTRFEQNVPVDPGFVGEIILVYGLLIPSLYTWTGAAWVAIAGAFTRTTSRTALVTFPSYNLATPTILEVAPSSTTGFPARAGMAAQNGRLYTLGEASAANTLIVRESSSGNLIKGFDIIGRVGEGAGLKTVEFSVFPDNTIASQEEWAITKPPEE